MARSGYFTVQRSFFEEWAAQIGPSGWMIWCALQADARPDGVSWHSALSIARRIGLSRETVQIGLRNLETRKLIERQIRKTQGPVTLYQYRLLDGRKNQPSDSDRRTEKPSVNSSDESEPAARRTELPAADGRKNRLATDGISDTGRTEFPAQSITREVTQERNTKKEHKSLLDFKKPKSSGDDSRPLGFAPKPAKKTAKTDPRYKALVAMCEESWNRMHEGRLLYVPPFGFGDRDRRAVREFLQRYLKHPVAIFGEWFDHREFSEAVNPAEMPGTYLPKLVHFANGRLDRFGKPIAESGPAEPGTYSYARKTADEELAIAWDEANEEDVGRQRAKEHQRFLDRARRTAESKPRGRGFESITAIIGASR